MCVGLPYARWAPWIPISPRRQPPAAGGGGRLSPRLDLPHRIPTPLASPGIQTVLSLQKLGARVSSRPPPWSPAEGPEGSPSSGLGGPRSGCGTMTASLQSTGENTRMLLPCRTRPFAGRGPCGTWPRVATAALPSVSLRSPRDTVCRENVPSLGTFPPPLSTLERTFDPATYLSQEPLNRRSCELKQEVVLVCRIVPGAGKPGRPRGLTGEPHQPPRCPVSAVSLAPW